VVKASPAVEIFMYAYFYLVTHRRRASKSGETSSKPLTFFGDFFFKISRNLRRNIPLPFLFFAFWRKNRSVCDPAKNIFHIQVLLFTFLQPHP